MSTSDLCLWCGNHTVLRDKQNQAECDRADCLLQRMHGSDCNCDLCRPVTCVIVPITNEGEQMNDALPLNDPEEGDPCPTCGKPLLWDAEERILYCMEDYAHG